MKTYRDYPYWNAMDNLTSDDCLRLLLQWIKVSSKSKIIVLETLNDKL